jgi:hypothetical protein
MKVPRAQLTVQQSVLDHTMTSAGCAIIAGTSAGSPMFCVRGVTLRS